MMQTVTPTSPTKRTYVDGNTNTVVLSGSTPLGHVSPGSEGKMPRSGHHRGLARDKRSFSDAWSNWHANYESGRCETKSFPPANLVTVSRTRLAQIYDRPSISVRVDILSDVESFKAPQSFTGGWVEDGGHSINGQFTRFSNKHYDNDDNDGLDQDDEMDLKAVAGVCQILRSCFSNRIILYAMGGIIDEMKEQCYPTVCLPPTDVLHQHQGIDEPSLVDDQVAGPFVASESVHRSDFVPFLKRRPKVNGSDSSPSQASSSRYAALALQPTTHSRRCSARQVRDSSPSLPSSPHLASPSRPSLTSPPFVPPQYPAPSYLPSQLQAWHAFKNAYEPTLEALVPVPDCSNLWQTVSQAMLVGQYPVHGYAYYQPIASFQPQTQTTNGQTMY
jgi:hypothetical protein